MVWFGAQLHYFWAGVLENLTYTRRPQFPHLEIVQ